jgi:tetratricopeptide (TPR) repeat protein
VAVDGAQRGLAGLGLRDRFRLLTDTPLTPGGDGSVLFDTRLPRALETVQFLRFVPLSSQGNEAAFESCPLLPVAVPSDAVAESSALAKADALWDKGAKLRALSVLEHAAKKTPNDAAVFKALASRTEQLAQWGDAVKAARRWALLDPTPEARLSLARLERATGHKERAVALIDGVLKDDPTSADAKTLLGDIRGQKLALSQ